MLKDCDDNTQRSDNWSNLDRQFRLPLAAYFQRRLRDRAEAEDLTQEVFIRLARHPDQNHGQTLEAYVFTIAASVLTDWRRHQAARRSGEHRTLSDIKDGTLLPAILVEDRTPERVLAAKEVLKELEDALAELDQRTREIFLLSRMEHIHHRDIANLHGISVSAVEKHVFKAMAYLSAKALK